jgi:zearalenone synthase (nonreducing iterative type I polyketide synthase)
MPTGESTAKILTTITMPTVNTLRASFTVQNGSTSYEIGECGFKVSARSALQSEWAKSTFFIGARMNEVIKAAKHGDGHRFKANIFYSLFSRTVEYDSSYKGIKEAYLTADFGEAAAEVVLQNDPSDPSASGVYWKDSLVHLAGFVANANPVKSSACTFMMNGFDECKLAADLHPGTYFSYVRVTRSEHEAFCCDVFVFDDTEKMVMQCSSLQFHAVEIGALDRLLGKVNTASSAVANASAVKDAELHIGQTSNLPFVDDVRPSGGINALDALLRAIAAETSTDMFDMADDAVLAELGVDSIMAMQIADAVKKETGVDIPGSFIFEHPTIGDIRRNFVDTQAVDSAINQQMPAFSLPDKSASYSAAVPNESDSSHESSSDEQSSDESNGLLGPPEMTEMGESDFGSNSPPRVPTLFSEEKPMTSPRLNPKMGSSLIKDTSVFLFQEEDQEKIEYESVPRAKVILMQGKPSSNETPLFLIPDGSGSAATYIHLARFKSGLPVYAIESPFLRCPGKLSRKTGIVGFAKILVEAILKARPEGPYLIGGYSGGAIIAFEVCRQFAAMNRKIHGLLLIDMCCPREMVDTLDDIPDRGLGMLMRLSPPDKRSFWTSSMATKYAQQHQRQVVRVISEYNPPAMAPEDRPSRVCLIWAKKGLVERVKTDTEALSMIALQNIPTESVPGFMTDARLGPIAWAVPNKQEADLGCNGWDKFVGSEIKILVVDADHLSLPIPPDVSDLSSDRTWGAKLT